MNRSVNIQQNQSVNIQQNQMNSNLMNLFSSHKECAFTITSDCNDTASTLTSDFSPLPSQLDGTHDLNEESPSQQYQHKEIRSTHVTHKQYDSNNTVTGEPPSSSWTWFTLLTYGL